jgi:hypothetical protein
LTTAAAGTVRIGSAAEGGGGRYQCSQNGADVERVRVKFMQLCIVSGTKKTRGKSPISCRRLPPERKKSIDLETVVIDTVLYFIIMGAVKNCKSTFD